MAHTIARVPCGRGVGRCSFRVLGELVQPRISLLPPRLHSARQVKGFRLEPPKAALLPIGGAMTPAFREGLYSARQRARRKESLEWREEPDREREVYVRHDTTVLMLYVGRDQAQQRASARVDKRPAAASPVNGRAALQHCGTLRRRPIRDLREVAGRDGGADPWRPRAEETMAHRPHFRALQMSGNSPMPRQRHEFHWLPRFSIASVAVRPWMSSSHERDVQEAFEDLDDVGVECHLGDLPRCQTDLRPARARLREAGGWTRFRHPWAPAVL
mmetsp:Transcript_30093/g.82676  ORF Transcript_30093/g.82676 Transcript_30093/m.82676 type:complete len:273 (-) Transcript_30093:1104-1922(-)